RWQCQHALPTDGETIVRVHATSVVAHRELATPKSSEDVLDREVDPQGAKLSYQRRRSKSRERSLLAARQVGAFTLIHSHFKPERYGASRSFETMPSRPMRSAARRSFAPSSNVSERRSRLSAALLMSRASVCLRLMSGVLRRSVP